MNAKRFAIGFIIMSPITFIITAIISFLYSLIVHGSGAVDWEHSISLALILGITVPLVRELEKKQKPS